MVEDRFQNFLNTSFPDSDSKDFIKQNKERIKNIKNDAENQREFSYYKALSNEFRFQMYKLLQTIPLCTCALAKLFGKKESVVNHHLKILEAEGLIEGEKQSYFTVYRPMYKKWSDRNIIFSHEHILSENGQTIRGFWLGWDFTGQPKKIVQDLCQST